MTEERITETRTPDGNSHTTVITEGGSGRSGGAGKWALVVVVLVLGVIALYFFTQTSGAEAARDNAIAEAAGEVGDAAGQIGDAAQEAADNLGK